MNVSYFFILQATLVLELPEGKIERHALTGISLPPLPQAKLHFDFPCKEYHQEILLVQNPLNEKQDVLVRTELVQPITTKSLFIAQGLEMVELLANSEKEYKWTIYIINEGQYEFKVRLKRNSKNFGWLTLIALTDFFCRYSFLRCIFLFNSIFRLSSLMNKPRSIFITRLQLTFYRENQWVP